MITFNYYNLAFVNDEELGLLVSAAKMKPKDFLAKAYKERYEVNRLYNNLIENSDSINKIQDKAIKAEYLDEIQDLENKLGVLENLIDRIRRIFKSELEQSSPAPPWFGRGKARTKRMIASLTGEG